MSQASLSRQLGLSALVATGVCSMLGASINVVPFMIQRHVPGIGPYVLYAFAFAAIPAILAAFAYSILATAMPRAGGSYIYASRGLNPYLGFVASFSQWFGLSIVIGVVAYVTVPFLRDIVENLGYVKMSETLDVGFVRVGIALILVWVFVYINILGAKQYEKTVIPLMILMFVLGSIVIVAGFYYTQNDFAQSYLEITGNSPNLVASIDFDFFAFLSAASILFASFIGFDSIAQAGGEAKDPTKKLPLAIGLTILIVGGYYILFSGAVYHAVPWSYIASEAKERDITAPGMMGYLLPSGLTVLIIAGAAIALINDLPAMLLSVSRLMFAWAEDGIFPNFITKVHATYNTPVSAIVLSGTMASLGIFGSHFAGDFFLGIDIMVTSMMVNFLLMCVTLLTLDQINPELAKEIRFVKSPLIRKWIGWSGVFVLSFFLVVHTWKDLRSDVDTWYFHSTPIWLIVMGIASLIFLFKYKSLINSGKNVDNIFKKLP